MLTACCVLCRFVVHWTMSCSLEVRPVKAALAQPTERTPSRLHLSWLPGSLSPAACLHAVLQGAALRSETSVSCSAGLLPGGRQGWA